jgi:predicted Fe-Mo cluster-binding NifX family protein
MKGNETDLIPEGIGKPALRALAAAGIKSLQDVARANEDDLLALHGVGPKAIRILREALNARRSRGGAKRADFVVAKSNASKRARDTHSVRSPHNSD